MPPTYPDRCRAGGRNRPPYPPTISLDSQPSSPHSPPRRRRRRQFGEAEEAGSSGSPGGDAGGAEGGSGPAAPFQGVPEVNPEVWSSITGDGGGPQATPRTVGVFFLDRFSEGFAAALQAAESAAERAAARLGRGGPAGGIGFVWADAPCQEGFTRALGVSDASVSIRSVS